MSFSPDVFQLNAFQWAADNVKRSGVVRMWLSEITARLNGIPYGDEEEAQAKKEALAKRPAPPKPEIITEQADGSVIVGKIGQKKKPIIKGTQNVNQLPTFKSPPSGTRLQPQQLAKRQLPTPRETTDFILGNIANDTQNQLWSEESVLKVLKQAAADNLAEEQLLEEMAIKLLF